ncbi:hypothetical protein [Lonepinella sp. BR2919]|uniref:hypothetical protein n=1 Tax=unclassified Lonepinella TaxID=2642006 RepID=UPI003F6E4428
MEIILFIFSIFGILLGIGTVIIFALTGLAVLATLFAYFFPVILALAVVICLVAFVMWLMSLSLSVWVTILAFIALFTLFLIAVYEQKISEKISYYRLNCSTIKSSISSKS